MIPYSRQNISREDIAAVVSVLRSDFITQGNQVPEFEQAISAEVSSQFGVAFNSATSALHSACLALGLGPGDILWTVPNTFVSSANCSLLCGGTVDFVDIDPITWNLSVPRLEDKLITARKEGKLPKIVVPVHFGGQPTEQEQIWELAKEFGFKVIEDASHSLGASRHNQPVGSCLWSDICIFSFHAVKIITTGEGGMATTNDSELSTRMSLIRSHGITRNVTKSKKVNEPWSYEQISLGYNYRMNDINAALGISQLSRLSCFLEKREIIAQRYTEALNSLPFRLPQIHPENTSSWHLFPVRLILNETRLTRLALFTLLREKGFETNVHYYPVHLQPFYRTLGFKIGQFPEAELFGSEALSLPIHPSLTEDQQNTAIKVLIDTLG